MPKHKKISSIELLNKRGKVVNNVSLKESEMRISLLADQFSDKRIAKEIFEQKLSSMKH